MAESQRRQQLLESLHEIVFQKFDPLLPDEVLFGCFCEVHVRVEALREIQRSATESIFQYSKHGTKESRQGRLVKLLEWFKTNGGILNDKLSVEHIGPDADDFGFVAKDTITADELLASVPPALCIPSSSDSVGKSSLAWLMKSKEIPPNMCLVFWLITQKLNLDVDQFMRPYVDSLPLRVKHVIYATPHSLKLLRDSFLCRKVILRYVSILRHYLILLNSVYASRMKRNKTFMNNLTFDLFRWASAIVQTRANTHYQRRLSVTAMAATGTGAATKQTHGSGSGTDEPLDVVRFEEDIALCPVLDLFNHETGSDKKDLDTASGYYKLLAMREFAASAEVTMHYSTLSNPERFVEQGFWPDKKADDENQTIVPVPLPAHFLKDLNSDDNNNCGENNGCHDAECHDSACGAKEQSSADEASHGRHHNKRRTEKLTKRKRTPAAEHDKNVSPVEERRNNVLQAYKVIREHLGANAVSYGTVGVLYLGAQARPHESAKDVATFLCLSPADQIVLLATECSGIDSAHNVADQENCFAQTFKSLCKCYPNLDRDAFIFLHKSIDTHIRDIRLHGNEPLPGNLDDEQAELSPKNDGAALSHVVNSSADIVSQNDASSESSWQLSMVKFFEHAHKSDMQFLERCLAHCKTVVRDLVKRSIEADRSVSNTKTKPASAINGQEFVVPVLPKAAEGKPDGEQVGADVLASNTGASAAEGEHGSGDVSAETQPVPAAERV